MIQYIIESSISLLVFLVFYKVALESEKMHQFNRFYLLGSLIISIIIPFVSIEVIQQAATIVAPLHLNTTIKNATVASVNRNTNYLPLTLCSIYGIVSVLLFFRFLKNMYYFKKTIINNEKISFKKATLVLLNEKIVPHTFLNYIFINKEAYESSAIEVELYEHELTHVHQKHTYDILSIEILKVIFWFNPLYYIYKKAIQLNHEFIADEQVVKKYTDVTFYQSLLLHTNDNKPYYLASNLNYLVTKKRLIMMTKNTSKYSSFIKKAGIIPLLLFLFTFLCFENITLEKTKNVVKGKENNTINLANGDEYYKGVRIIKAEKAIIYKDTTILINITIDKLFEDLTDDEISQFGKNWFEVFKPKPLVKNVLTQKNADEYKNTKKYAIWIDGINVPNNKLSEYKLKDFAYHSGSVILKNARTKKHPQPFQYWFYTHKYFNENKMGAAITKYPGDKITTWGKTEKINANYSSNIK